MAAIHILLAPSSLVPRTFSYESCEFPRDGPRDGEKDDFKNSLVGQFVGWQLSIRCE